MAKRLGFRFEIPAFNGGIRCSFSRIAREALITMDRSLRDLDAD
jgi:hypothetical protein